MAFSIHQSPSEILDDLRAFEVVREIPREPSGKFRVVRSIVHAD
jgi:hypothetical protein